MVLGHGSGHSSGPWFWVILNLLPPQGLQVFDPAGLVQVLFRSGFDGASFGFLDHDEQQQDGNQTQTWGHLGEGRGRVSKGGGAWKDYILIGR